MKIWLDIAVFHEKNNKKTPRVQWNYGSNNFQAVVR